MQGCRIGCLSNTQGAIVTTEDFSFIDNTYKAVNSENVIKSQADDYTLMYLTDKNFRKVFYYQYKTAFERSRRIIQNSLLMRLLTGCNLTEDETAAALRLLKDTRINEVYTDTATKTKKYVFFDFKCLVCSCNLQACRSVVRGCLLDGCERYVYDF